jgi:hypothetical protein
MVFVSGLIFKFEGARALYRSVLCRKGGESDPSGSSLSFEQDKKFLALKPPIVPSSIHLDKARASPIQAHGAISFASAHLNAQLHAER